MAMDWGEIILPVTPPVVLAVTISTSGRPSCAAVVACRAANKALAEVSLPVRNTPSQPSKALKNGNSAPVAAKAMPIVTMEPE